MKDYDMFDSTDFDHYCRSLSRLFVKGGVIVNDYISWNDAIAICYCFN